MIKIFQNNLNKKSTSDFKQMPSPICKIAIGAKIQGLREFDALIDTGCELAIIITKDLAKELGVEITGSTKNLMADQKTKVEMPTGSVTVKLAGITFESVPCSVGSEGADKVIVGTQLLQYFDYSIVGGKLHSITQNKNAVGALLRAEPQFYSIKI